jgi:replicative DNA helicase
MTQQDLAQRLIEAGTQPRVARMLAARFAMMYDEIARLKRGLEDLRRKHEKDC